jgi:hypothetical protein
MPGRAAEVAAVSALAFVLTLAVAAPVLRAPSERIFGMELVGRHHDPFTVMERFDRPIAYDLYLQPLTDIPGALLARWFGPVAAYNWLVLLTFPLSAVTAYLLARHLTLAPASAAFAAIAFAFSPFHLAHSAYHPHIAQIEWVPLYFLALWKCLDHATPGTAGLLAAAAAGTALSNFYGGLIAAVVTPPAVGAYWLFTRRGEARSSRQLAATIAGVVLIAGGGLAYASYAAPAVIASPAAYGFPRSDLFLYSAKWWSYLVPPVANPVLGATAERLWSAAGVHEGLLEQQVSLGWGVVALGLVATAARLSPRHHSSVAIVPVLAIVASVALLCSLSPERTVGAFTFTRPSAILYAVVPMFRSYARFGVVVQLMAVLLAGIGAERLWRGAKGARIACGVLVALAACEYAVWTPLLWRDVLPTAAHRWIASQPGRVRGVDCAPLTQESASIQWLTSNRVVLRPAGFEDCTEPELADKLSAAGYTHLLVRRDTPEGRWFASHGAPAGLRVAARFGDAEVLAVTAPPPVLHTIRMKAFYPREYDDAWTWRWMGSEASWTIANSSASAIAAVGDLEIAAFNGPRRLKVLLDGREIQSIEVQDKRGIERIGPLTLSPGNHEIVFRPVTPAMVADDILKNGDSRPLSFGFGAWRWVVDGASR